jgi:NAD(P)H-nitrite reductase large subunit
MTLRLVIIGNGMAATPGRKLSESARPFAITIIGDEPGHAYNRIQLSPVLGQKKRQRHRPARCAVVQGARRHGADGETVTG